MPKRKDIQSYEKLSIVHYFNELKCLNIEMSKGELKKTVANKYNCSIRTVERILKEFNDLKEKSPTESVDFHSNMKKRPGRPCKLTEPIKKKIRHENKEGNFSPSYRTLAVKVNLCKSTAYNYCKRMGCTTMTQRVKPKIDSAQMKERLRYVLNLRDGRSFRFKAQYNVVHVDESWFYLYQEKRVLRLFPEDKAPEPGRVQHKSHIQKIMFICAVARPRPEDNFDGKIYISRIQHLKSAKRNSINHNRGDVYLADCNITSELFFVYMKEIMQAVKIKMQRFRNEPIIIQFDGAGPHKGKGNLENLNRIGKLFGWNIQFIIQPPQSPDLNVNDLGFFRSLKMRVNNLKNNGQTTDLLSERVMEAWNSYDANTLERIWGVQYEVYREIMKNKGEINFSNPRLSRKIGDSNVNLEFDQQVFNEAKNSVK